MSGVNIPEKSFVSPAPEAVPSLSVLSGQSVAPTSRSVVSNYSSTSLEGSVANASSYEQVGGSDLATLSPPRQTSDLFLLLQKAQVMLGIEGVEKGKEDVMTLSNKRKDLHQERLEAIKDAMEAQRNAKKSGIFGKVFGWMAAAATAVAGGALVALGASAPVGALMLGLAADQLIGMGVGHSAMSELTSFMSEGFVALGMSDSWGAALSMTVMIGATVALTMGAGYLASGSKASAGAAGAGAQSSTSVAGQSTAVAGQAASTAGQSTLAGVGQYFKSNGVEMLMRVRDLGIFVGAGAQVGVGAASIVTANHQKEAADAGVVALEIGKFLTQNESRLENAIEHMKEQMRNMESVLSRMVEVINQERNSMEANIKAFA